jgi:hypothetical protein
MKRCWSFAVVLLLPMTLAAQESLEFADRTWATVGTVQVETYMGRPALRMRGGRALLEGMEFTNGTIEFDIAVTGHRSFVGLTFRRSQPAGQAESFYLRPHQSGRFDAVQYTPVENGISAWQLFPEGNAEVIIPANVWLPVRLEVAGYDLTVFVGDGKEPTLTARLATDRTSGLIALNSGVPGGTGGISAPPEILTTSFSNFRVTPNTDPVPMAEYEAPDPRFVTEWDVSQAVAGPEEAPAELSTDLVPIDGWVSAATDYTGRLNLARYRGFPEDANRGMVLARTAFTSDRDQVKRLGIGFSDVGSVFLNGHLVYNANNAYLSRSGRYLGVMTVEDVISLHLRKGRNEIVVAVIENFGGWGLVAKWEDLEGIE